VYDVTRRDSFDHVTAWLKELEVYATFPNLVKMLVANKIDLVRPGWSLSCCARAFFSFFSCSCI
jgi:hypothetical protein